MSQQDLFINQEEITSTLINYSNRFNNQYYTAKIKGVRGETIQALLNIYDEVYKIPDSMNVQSWVEFLMDMLRSHVHHSFDNNQPDNTLRDELVDFTLNTHMLIRLIIAVQENVIVFQDSTKQFSEH